MKREKKNPDGISQRKQRRLGRASWVEQYLDQRYIKIGDTEVYAVDSEGNQWYSTNDQNEYVYAKKVIAVGEEKHTVEYPARNKSGGVDFAKDKGNIRYPRNITTGDVYVEADQGYPLDEDGKAMYPRNDGDGMPIYFYKADGTVLFIYVNGEPVYGKDLEENEVYPKDKDNNQIPIHVQLGDKTLVKYAKDKEGHEFYPKDKDGKQLYVRDGNMEIGARRNNSEAFYAQQKDGSEYYPKRYTSKDKHPDEDEDEEEMLEGLR